VSLTFVVFDALQLDGESTMHLPYSRRRALADDLELGTGPWFVPDAFADGNALFAAACEHGLEGVIAKRRSAPCRPGQRGWVKVKNCGYWRYDAEMDSLRRSIERRQRRHRRLERSPQ
jgi:bifunctional non-homologous end joining protein LigD